MLTLVTVEEYMDSPFYGQEDYDKVERALEWAERRFYRLTERDYLGYWLTPREVTFLVHGNGEKLVRFPWPVLEIHEVKDLDEDVVLEGVRHWGSHYIFYGAGFPDGIANIRVHADTGDPNYALDPLPEDVSQAIKRLARNQLMGDRIAGERTIDFRPPTEETPAVMPTITGDREVDGVIRSYMTRDLTGGLLF